MNKYPHPIVTLLLCLVGVLLNILFIPFTLVERTYTIITNYEEFKAWMWSVAMTFTQRGNVYHSGIYNRFVWHTDGAKSGNPDESMSSVTGKNEYLEKKYNRGYRWYKIGKYKFAPGKWQSKLLNWLDNNHGSNAIEHDEGTKI